MIRYRIRPCKQLVFNWGIPATVRISQACREGFFCASGEGIDWAHLSIGIKEQLGSTVIDIRRPPKRPVKPSNLCIHLCLPEGLEKIGLNTVSSRLSLERLSLDRIRTKIVHGEFLMEAGSSIKHINLCAVSATVMASLPCAFHEVLLEMVDCESVVTAYEFRGRMDCSWVNAQVDIGMRHLRGSIGKFSFGQEGEGAITACMVGGHTCIRGVGSNSALFL